MFAIISQQADTFNLYVIDAPLVIFQLHDIGDWNFMIPINQNGLNISSVTFDLPPRKSECLVRVGIYL